MSLDTERSAIEARFEGQWTVGGSLRTPVGWDGQAFEPPTDSSSVRLTILSGEGSNMSMGDPGNNLVRYAGVVMFQVFTAGGSGSKAARDLADLIRPIFTNWRSGALLFRVMRIGTPDTTPPFFMLPVHFPFQRDETHG